MSWMEALLQGPGPSVRGLRAVMDSNTWPPRCLKCLSEIPPPQTLPLSGSCPSFPAQLFVFEQPKLFSYLPPPPKSRSSIFHTGQEGGVGQLSVLTCGRWDGGLGGRWEETGESKELRFYRKPWILRGFGVVFWRLAEGRMCVLAN